MSPFKSESFLICAALTTKSMHWIKARQNNVVDFIFLMSRRKDVRRFFDRSNYLNVQLHEIKKICEKNRKNRKKAICL